ncbi:MAG: cytochrome P450 [Chloroflexota bacterium]|nr:cytochrome P450 [Chloroflexota bacterium]
MLTAINDEMFSGEAITDPYSYYGRIRDEDPVHWNELYELWVITRHDDLVWMTRHHELFSSEFWARDKRSPYPAIDESDLGLYQFMREFFMKWFIQHDRPVHTDQRKVVHKWFNPTSMEMWRPMVKSVVKDMLDEADQNGRMDVMKDFATPLPLFVIAQMMGMPFEDRKFIRSMAEKLLFIGRGEADRMQPLTDGIKELMEYLSPLVAQKVDLPVDENDLLSVLASGEKSGALTRDEVVADAILLLLAGHETTINLICNGTLAFTQHPDQWKLLQEAPHQEPDTLVRATEECLRYDPPVKSIQRIASEDVEMGGKLIKEGDRIRWFMSSANRDPSKHENPDTFDISRWPNTHVAFGSGIHHCLGATLARLEAQEAFKALAERYESINLEADDFEYQPSVTFRSLKSLPVSLK